MRTLRTHLPTILVGFCAICFIVGCGQTNPPLPKPVQMPLKDEVAGVSEAVARQAKEDFGERPGTVMLTVSFWVPGSRANAQGLVRRLENLGWEAGADQRPQTGIDEWSVECKRRTRIETAEVSRLILPAISETRQRGGWYHGFDVREHEAR